MVLSRSSSENPVISSSFPSGAGAAEWALLRVPEGVGEVD